MYPLPTLSPEEILIYLRKSRTDDPSLTVAEVLAKHEKMLNDWMERHLSGPVPEENRYREVVSGETIDSRPQIQSLLRRTESPRIKAVLCVECQRLSRGDLMDIGYLVKMLRYSNTIVITLDYAYDLTLDHDRESFERELKRGNEFLEYTKTILRRGTENAITSGAYLGRYAPYGYQKITIREGKRDIHTLTPDPEAAPVVKMIFQMYANGSSSGEVARTLNEMGIPSMHGRKWTRATLTSIRQNVHYLGLVRWNYRKTVRTVENGEVVESRPRNKTECMICPGRHEPIIDKDLWDAVQEIVNKIPPVKDRVKCANPFSGLVYCRCGSCMSRRTYKKRYNGVLKERSAPRLLCDNQTECDTASCTVEEMQQLVVAELRKAIADFDLKINSEPENSTDIHRQIIGQLEKRLEDLNKQELSQWDKYTQEGMPKHIFDQLNQKVLREKDETLQALHDARNNAPTRDDFTIKRATFQTALDLLLDETAPALEQNMLLKQCIERIDYSRKKKTGPSRRYGTPEPIEVDIHLRV